LSARQPSDRALGLDRGREKRTTTAGTHQLTRRTVYRTSRTLAHA